MSILLLAIPIGLVILLIVNVKKNAEEQVSPGLLRQIDYLTQPRPAGYARNPYYAKPHTLKCLGCGDEMDLDLFGQEPEARGNGADKFWREHYDHNQQAYLPANNETQKPDLPGS